VWWLIYRRDDKIVGVAIFEAPSLHHAREPPSLGSERPADYSESQEIDAAHVIPDSPRSNRQVALTRRRD